MSFSDAIPLNRITYGQAPEFDLKSRRDPWHGESAPDKRPKQSVNISQDTMIRLARSKLARAVNQKLAYNQSGALSQEQPVGTLLSVKV